MNLFALISTVTLSTALLIVLGFMLRSRGYNRLAAVVLLGAGAGLTGLLSPLLVWLADRISQVAAVPWLLAAVCLFLFLRVLFDLFPKLNGTATPATAVMALVLPVVAGVAGSGWLSDLVATVSGAVLTAGDSAMTAAF